MNKNKKDLLILLLFGILWAWKPISYEDVVRNQLIREKTVVTNLNFNGGGQNSQGKSSIGRKILLEKLFPDWSDRVDFQKKQQKFFESGRKRLISAKRVRVKIKLTPEEQDAFDYFSGTGFYKKHQSPETFPNKLILGKVFLKR